MSIAASAISEAPLSGQSAHVEGSRKPPRRREIVAKADALTRPEAR
jgi:hypothetical protein